MSRTPDDRHLLDALEAVPPVSIAGTVWRVVQCGRDPREASAAGGRWDEGEVAALYTSCEPAGAAAELLFHLRRGQPVFPSRMEYCLHALRVFVSDALNLSEPGDLATLGVDMTCYGRLAYADRAVEYTRTQAVAKAARRLERSALLVPSARWACSNLVLLGGAPADAVVSVQAHGPVDWPTGPLARSVG